jgi:hypothetical protein
MKQENLSLPFHWEHSSAACGCVPSQKPVISRHAAIADRECNRVQEEQRKRRQSEPRQGKKTSCRRTCFHQQHRLSSQRNSACCGREKTKNFVANFRSPSLLSVQYSSSSSSISAALYWIFISNGRTTRQRLQRRRRGYYLGLRLGLASLEDFWKERSCSVNCDTFVWAVCFQSLGDDASQSLFQPNAHTVCIFNTTRLEIKLRYRHIPTDTDVGRHSKLLVNNNHCWVFW